MEQGSESFADWLSDQRGRADAVGRLASAVAAGERTGHAEEVLELARSEWRSADIVPEIEDLRRRAARAERVRIKYRSMFADGSKYQKQWDRVFAERAARLHREATELELSR
jgi:hypothetical protein